MGEVAKREPFFIMVGMLEWWNEVMLLETEPSAEYEDKDDEGNKYFFPACMNSYLPFLGDGGLVGGTE